MTVGISENFPTGDRKRVEQALIDLSKLEVAHLRVEVDLAEADWLDWALPLLATKVELLPVLVGAPTADAVSDFVGRLGRHFPAVEIGRSSLAAAPVLKAQGMRVVLGADAQKDLDRVAEFVDVVGARAYPDVHQAGWQGWDAEIDRVRAQAEGKEVWVTETGFSTWRSDAWGQASALVRALQANVDRVYWFGLYDAEEDQSTAAGFHVDEREYHFGLKTADGKPKTLFRIWGDQGLDSVVAIDRSLTPHIKGEEPVTVITGGTGFVGTNVADREVRAGRRVRIFDNLTRPGVEHNLKWLRETHGDAIELIVGDVRDRYALRYALQGARRVYHFAAQVAVTTSVDDPRNDFDVNGVGTVNLLEELRRFESPPSLLFTSTNKVYGDLGDLALRRTATRYEPKDPQIRGNGVNEDRMLDFHSPYGCSKGLADQYVLDYARTYGLPTVVFRMSCIYGPHQFGNEDQGWVAHFVIKALQDEAITLYGDGKQVRDVLFVEDLVDAMATAIEKIGLTTGRAFNIGGGAENTTSLLELLGTLAELTGRPVETRFDGWRVGDQRYYVSDTARFREMTGWRPKVGVREGVARLAEWLLNESPTIRPTRRLVEDYARNITVR